ncbi:uncharacterized protein N7518_001847 [Penicillium psychrosexuale]|uniref:uncharacterized protein n=1 Tax=Penicillium psychrosexuale TaxID=1002107 RepID=UPI002544DCE5|nr:uncharacterized protein N7518_001847 [Penicillium psychrosexuale]KAJ5799779.1 hypothetical protein N7518_001847 [Penicillium psychrosexuale]
MPDAMIIQVKALISNPKSSEDIMERQILLVECKRPSRDTPLGWDDTITGQFLDDLSQTLNFSERLFGAVAIGKKVKFYQFDGKAQVGQQLAPLHQGILDMDDPNGCSQVEGMMNHIKANAWQWAISL